MNSQKTLAERSVTLIYRDCFKIIPRMVKQPNTVNIVRQMLRKQFDRNRNQFDQDKIHALKMNAVKGISNYLIHTIQQEHKLLKKKPINIYEEEDELEHRH